MAIKVLPSHLSASPEVRQRFEREAKTSRNSLTRTSARFTTSAAKAKPSIWSRVSGGGNAGGAAREGTASLDQVLKIGSQIAEDLDAAHRMGIVHRDLKPGDVMITKSGARVLDFGLAKLREEEEQPAASRLSALATRDAPLTAEGTILGTVQYMAPEQLEGKTADARTDIFAFGVMLYETVTGKKAFSGASQASLLSAILATEPPPVSASQAMSPPALDRLVRTYLAKDPEHRWQSARDIALQIAMISEAREAAPVPAPGALRRSAPWVIAASVLSLAIVLLPGARAADARREPDPILRAASRRRRVHELGGGVRSSALA